MLRAWTQHADPSPGNPEDAAPDPARRRPVGRRLGAASDSPPPPADAADDLDDLRRRELNPELLSQLRELQDWASRGAAAEPARREPAPAQDLAPAPPPQETSETQRPERPRQARQAVAPPRLPARRAPRRSAMWAAVAALLLLGCLGAYLLRRGLTARDTAAPSPAERRLETTAAAASSPDVTSPTVAPSPVVAAPPNVAPPSVVPASPTLGTPPIVTPAPAVAAPPTVPTSPPVPADRRLPLIAPPPPSPQRSPSQETATEPAATSPADVPSAPASQSQRGQGARTRITPARRWPSNRRVPLLLTPGPGVRLPELLSLPALSYSRSFRRRPPRPQLAGSGGGSHSASHLRLAILVNESGRVSNVQLRSGDTSDPQLDQLALRAAMAARYRPATRYGVPGRMWTSLTFDFRP